MEDILWKSFVEISLTLKSMRCYWSFIPIRLCLGIDGLELYKAVRKEESLKNTPFMMVTVEDSKEKVTETLKLAIKDYIVKPLQKNSFETKVKNLLKI